MLWRYRGLTMDKTKFIPHDSWRGECKAVYYFKNGLLGYEGKECFLALSKDGKYVYDALAIQYPSTWEPIYSTFSVEVSKAVEMAIPNGELMWSCNDIVNNKRYKLVDRGSYFETVEV